MQEKRVESVQEIDFSGMNFPYIAVYEHPEDFPEKYVARVWDMDKPTDTIIVKDELREIEEDIRENTNLTFLPRGMEDVISLVGVWM